LSVENHRDDWPARGQRDRELTRLHGRGEIGEQRTRLSAQRVAAARSQAAFTPRSEARTARRAAPLTAAASVPLPVTLSAQIA